MDNVLERVNELIIGDQWPHLIGLDVSDNHIALSLYIVDSISWFSGHFPEQAVLPGVVQLHWAVKLAQVVFPDLLAEGKRFNAVNNVKFKMMILPGQVIDLDLKYDEAKHTVRFSYRNGGDVFSTATLLFSTPVFAL